MWVIKDQFLLAYLNLYTIYQKSLYDFGHNTEGENENTVDN